MNEDVSFFKKLVVQAHYSGRFRKPLGAASGVNKFFEKNVQMWHTLREEFSNWTAPWYANEMKFNFVLCWCGAHWRSKQIPFIPPGGGKEESNEITAVDDNLICNSWSKRRPNNWIDRHCRGRWRRHLICILSRCKHVNRKRAMMLFQSFSGI